MPGNYSQGWPGLVFLSRYVFVPEQQRPRLPDEEFDRILFNDLMLADETAHQWWGDAVLWAGYRDQWISEALANYCAMLSLETEHPAEFRAILAFYRKELAAKNANGEERGQAGPVTLGQRLVSSHFPQGYDDIAYGRGTWLIHMLREMLRDSERKESTAVARSLRQRARGSEAPDDLFFSMLRNIQTRYAGKQLSTRQFQQAFEEVLPKELQFEGHKSLDWFFEGWVRGTAMPTYALEDVKISLRTGKPVAAGTLLQKNAPDTLVMAVPVYASMTDGTLRFVARVFADGDETTFKLPVPVGTKKLVIDPEQTLLTHP
jgi:aminopeptidase N